MSFEGGVFLSHKEGYLARKTMDKILTQQYIKIQLLIKTSSLHLSKFSSSVYKSAKPIMCDILVYVNKSSFCCVIAENTDATLESFRHKMEAQVDNLLCSPFKFTRLVKSNCVTVGVKQEAFIKLKQCIDESHEAAIYLIREETKNSIMDCAFQHGMPSHSLKSMPFHSLKSVPFHSLGVSFCSLFCFCKFGTIFC